MEKRAPRKRENVKPGTVHTGEPPTATPTCAEAQSESPCAEPLRVAIIGGGVAGVTAAEELLRLVPRGAVRITIITAGSMLKEVGKVVQVTRTLEDIEVVERDAAEYSQSHEHVEVLKGRRVQSLDAQAKTILLDDGSLVSFDKCLVCSGARPHLVSAHPHVVGIRDTESVEQLSVRLASAQRVAVIGNGGIALEIVHAVRTCEVLWLVKDDYIGNTFFDASASSFILPELRQGREVQLIPRGQPLPTDSACVTNTGKPRRKKRPRAEGVGEGLRAVEGYGGALGPDWLKTMGLEGGRTTQEGGGAVGEEVGRLLIAFGKELQGLREPEGGGGEGDDWPLYVTVTGGQSWGCDFVVSATGVLPNVEFLGPEFARGEDGGVLVNEHMQTTGSGDVYAAGDCCSMTWPDSDVWFQMRLWGQARSMAAYAARCLVGMVDELGSGFAFELFAHSTRFFNYRVVLLGCFNAQLLKDQSQRQLVREVLVRADGSVEATSLADNARQPPPSPPPPDHTTAAAAPSSQPAEGGAQPCQPQVEVWTRVTPGSGYIKVVVVDGRIKGAMIVGESDLPETLENLILNRLDVSRYGVALLEDDVDVEDYFD